MGLAKDFEDILWKGLGGSVSKEFEEKYGRGNIPTMAKELSEALIDFLQEQTFTITKMKAVTEMEEIKTAAPLSANVLPTVSILGSGTGIITGNVLNGTRGVQIPTINLKKRGSRQGGSLTARGHSYIGTNPISSNKKNDDHGDNKVKLLKIKRGTR